VHQYLSLAYYMLFSEFYISSPKSVIIFLENKFSDILVF
jgi:hypothetical protein